MFLFVLPWQTRYIFGWSYLSGEPTQFGVLSLYVTQVLLIVGLLVMYAWRGLPKFAPVDKRILLAGGAFFLVVLVSALTAKVSVPACAGLLDVAVALSLVFALLDSRVDRGKITFALALGLCLPVLLGLFQVLTGGNGPSVSLGLAARDAERPGDAVVMLVDGVRSLRAYGSFPHPNIFGGYLAIGLLSLFAYRSVDETPKQRLFIGIVSLILGLGLILTASRSAIFGLGLGLVMAMVSRRLQTRKLVAAIATTAVFLAFLVTYAAPSVVTSLRGGGALEQRSVSERVQQYRDWPTTMHGLDWLIGNGPRNYVFALADEHPQQSVWDYQPIHNVPLLMLSELGVMGVLLALIFGCLSFRHVATPAAIGMAACLCVIMCFDHYLWSSWAGVALFAYVLAVGTQQSSSLSTM